MEGFNPNKEIGEMKGSEIYNKIKHLLLGKFRAKKEFLQEPSVKNSALLEMTSFLFIRILTKVSEENKQQFHKKTASELYGQIFELNMTSKQFEKKVWEEIGDINEQIEVKEGGLSLYAIHLFEPKLQKIKNDLTPKPKDYTDTIPFRENTSERWDKKVENREEETEQRMRELNEREGKTNPDQE